MRSARSKASAGPSKAPAAATSRAVAPALLDDDLAAKVAQLEAQLAALATHRAAEDTGLGATLAAYKAKVAAQAAVITALEEELATVTGGDPVPLPAKSIFASGPYKALEAKAKEAAQALAASQKEAATLKAQNADLQRRLTMRGDPIVEMVATVTGLRMVRLTPAGAVRSLAGVELGVYACKLTGSRADTTVQFTLEFMPDDGLLGGIVTVEFIPGPGCEACLPAFLHESIVFGLDQCSVFFTKVMQAMNVEEEAGSSGAAAGEAAVEDEETVTMAAPSAAPAAPAAAPREQQPLRYMASPRRTRGAAAKAAAMVDEDAASAAPVTPTKVAATPTPGSALKTHGESRTATRVSTSGL